MSGSVLQSGPITFGHVPMWLANGTLMDGGGADAGALTQFGITNDGGLAFGINSGPINVPYTSFGISVSSSGEAAITVGSFNGGPLASLDFVINGITYSIINSISTVVSVVSISTLRALAQAVPAPSYNVEGYYAPGDGGGGIFYWVPTDTTSVDNGGTIIVDTIGHRYYRQVGSDGWTVLQFGVVLDGVTDNVSTLNNAIAVISAAGGGLLTFPVPGICIVGATAFLRAGVKLVGCGQGATVIKGQSGAAFDVIQTLGYAGLVGTNTPSGPYQFGLQALTIDGNKSGSRGSTNTCLSLYGYDFTIQDVDVRNSPSVGLYSEWSTSGNVPVANGGNSMEAHFCRTKFFSCQTDGLVFNGPHDSIFIDTAVFINGRFGANFGQGAAYTAGGCFINNMHSYGNGNWGIVVDTSIIVSAIESESNASGGGIQVNTPGGAISGTTISVWGNTGPGLYMNIGGSNISVISTHNNTGDGITINVGSSILSSIDSFTNGGSGVLLSATGAQCTLSAIRTLSNTGPGIAVLSNDNRVSDIWAFGNTGGGLVIGNATGGNSISGELNGNTGTQCAFNTLALGCIIDLSVFTNAGQTAWSGVVGNNFVRLGASGSDVRPINSIQT